MHYINMLLHMHLLPNMTLNLNAKVKTKGPWAAFHDQLSEKDQKIAELQAQVSVSMCLVRLQQPLQARHGLCRWQSFVRKAIAAKQPSASCRRCMLSLQLTARR